MKFIVCNNFVRVLDIIVLSFADWESQWNQVWEKWNEKSYLTFDSASLTTDSARQQNGGEIKICK